jgi:hypothetical protein
MTGRTLMAVIVGLALAVPVFAGDIVSMPTANVVQPKNIELNAIYWMLPPSGSTGNVTVGEAFLGVYDRLEIDVLYADIKDFDNFTEVNAYYTLLKESATRPGLIAGFTNVLGNDWLGGAKFPGGDPDYDQPSFVVASAFNLAAPAEISPKTPLIRAHLGWGDRYHESKLFGGIQFKIYPTFGGAAFNYKGDPAYMLTWAPAKKYELTAGTIGGETFYRAGAFLHW